MKKKHYIQLSEEPFMSFQGEAGQVGQLSVFIRTSSCPNHCFDCDTKFSWNNYIPYTRNDIYNRLFDFIAKRSKDILNKINFVWTGGEPLRFIKQINSINRAFKLNYTRFIIETSGNTEGKEIKRSHLASFDEFNISYKTPSMTDVKYEKHFFSFLSVIKTLKHKVVNFKFVVKDEKDIEFISQTLYEISYNGLYSELNDYKIFVMPYTVNGTIDKNIIELCKKTCIKMKWHYSPRLHITEGFK